MSKVYWVNLSQGRVATFEAANRDEAAKIAEQHIRDANLAWSVWGEQSPTLDKVGHMLEIEYDEMWE